MFENTFRFKICADKTFAGESIGILQHTDIENASEQYQIHSDPDMDLLIFVLLSYENNKMTVLRDKT